MNLCVLEKQKGFSFWKKFKAIWGPGKFWVPKVPKGLSGGLPREILGYPRAPGWVNEAAKWSINLLYFRFLEAEKILGTQGISEAERTWGTLCRLVEVAPPDASLSTTGGISCNTLPSSNKVTCLWYFFLYIISKQALYPAIDQKSTVIKL